MRANYSQDTRNNAVDCFRYIAAILVVSVHTDPLVEFQPLLSYLIVHVIPCIAVPFFFAISGYYCSVKLDKETFKLWSYLRRLLVPYVIWTAIYFAYESLMYGLPELTNWALSFLIYGSVYHFWFFPALILSVCVMTLLYRAEKLIVPLGITLALLGCLGHGYYQIGVQLPLLKMLYNMDNWVWFCHVFFLGLPSFFLGFLIHRTLQKWQNEKNITVALVIVFLLYLAEVAVIKILDLSRAITETLCLLPLVYFLIVWLLRHPMAGKRKLAETCRTLANFTYYSHVLFIMIFNETNGSLLDGTLTATVKFLFVIVLTLSFGLLVCRSRNNKIKVLAA